MGLPAAKKRLLQQKVQEIKEILGTSVHPDGRPKTFAELEDECIEAGDLLSAATLQELVAVVPAGAEVPCCPTCHRPGETHPEEPRILQTDRGEVSWLEPNCYCRSCRRSFFPSVS
jgi:hypothetical protein